MKLSEIFSMKTVIATSLEGFFGSFTMSIYEMGTSVLQNSYGIHLTTANLFDDHSSITNFGSILDCKICIENAQICLKSEHFPNLLELNALEIDLNLFKVTKYIITLFADPTE